MRMSSRILSVALFLSLMLRVPNCSIFMYSPATPSSPSLSPPNASLEDGGAEDEEEEEEEEGERRDPKRDLIIRHKKENDVTRLNDRLI